MLTVYAAVIGAAVAAVAICLSAVSLLLHYVNREKHPDVSALHTRCDQLQLAQTDMLDRIEHWTRRDRVRRIRDAQGETEPQATAAPQDIKAALRQQLRATK